MAASSRVRVAAVCAAVTLLVVLLAPCALATKEYRVPVHTFFNTPGASGSFKVSKAALYLRLRMVGAGRSTAESA